MQNNTQNTLFKEKEKEKARANADVKAITEARENANRPQRVAPVQANEKKLPDKYVPVRRKPASLSRKSKRKPQSKEKLTAGRIALRCVAVLMTFVLSVVILLYCGLGMLCINKGINYITVPTFLETGAFKFIPSLYLSDKKIQEIVDRNKMKDMDAEVDESLINSGNNYNSGALIIDTTITKEENEEIVNRDQSIEIHEVSGATY